ncbi:lipoprotein [Streptomyces cinereoruber]|uniref:Lipoprotein n=1 Tax=Streptomyces cinereoruber TaxID=67260 RepID=A0AAV4KF79_9ACTN|nr:YncE family protein [Streptomyces cinereoruber]MBB4159061.1 YVTN family beta-propeller protein [Streptomyces cinereoruber]MBY8816783.1 YncE family protein [Streptomyces cinereoruber]NIH63248.1 YVTN family beta-propeller protein [Streptomyces cinereoruber]QEV31235.1 YncE family protein [Streptomyces cinereoruber]GGR18116.1 lipoprotein [Streptomyces cinereoruber]
MPKSRRPSRAARTLLPGAVAAVLLTGCAPGSGGAAEADPSASGKANPSPTAVTPSPESGGPAPGTLLVADFGSDTVTFVDPARGAVGSVEVGTAPYGLALGADGRAWVATAEGVAVVDTAARERLALIPYRTDTGPVTTGEYRGGGMGIALAPDGRRAYVGVNVPGGNGALEVIDTAALRVTDAVPVGRRPFDVDVSEDGAEVYATNHDSFDVTVVAAGTPEARRVEVAPYGTEGGLGSWLKPHYAAVRPSDGRLLLPFEGERLAVVDPRTGRTEIEPMTANTHQHGVAVTADGTLLAVGTGPVDPDEDRGPSLTVRAPDGKERVYPLEGPHEDVAVSRDGRTAYVTGGFTRDGYWDGLTVVDLESGDTRRLAAGSRPLGIAVL